MACSSLALLHCLPAPAKAEAAGRERPRCRLRWWNRQSQFHLFTRQRRGHRPASRQQGVNYRQKEGMDTLPFALGRGDRHMQHNLDRSACKNSYSNKLSTCSLPSCGGQQEVVASTLDDQLT